MLRDGRHPVRAAAGLAAIACHDLPGATVATVLTGTDPPPLLAQVLQDRTRSFLPLLADRG